MQCSAVQCSAVVAVETMAVYINILTQNKELNYNSVTLYVGVVRSYENKLGKSQPEQISALKESALRPILSSSRNVSLSIYLYIYLYVPLSCNFFRPLIGPHDT